jgi:hypothetical protein
VILGQLPVRKLAHFFVRLSKPELERQARLNHREVLALACRRIRNPKLKPAQVESCAEKSIAIAPE